MTPEDLVQVEWTLEARRRLADLIQVRIPQGVGTEIETDDARIY